MRVDHCRTHVGVSKKFLNGAQVIAVFQQVRGEAVAQRVVASVLRDAGQADGALHRPLHAVRRGVMKSEGVVLTWIGGEVRRREDVLPRPFPRRLRVLACQRIRKLYGYRSLRANLARVPA